MFSAVCVVETMVKTCDKTICAWRKFIHRRNIVICMNLSVCIFWYLRDEIFFFGFLLKAPNNGMEAQLLPLSKQTKNSPKIYVNTINATRILKHKIFIFVGLCVTTTLEFPRTMLTYTLNDLVGNIPFTLECMDQNFGPEPNLNSNR